MCISQAIYYEFVMAPLELGQLQLIGTPVHEACELERLIEACGVAAAVRSGWGRSQAQTSKVRFADKPPGTWSVTFAALDERIGPDME